MTDTASHPPSEPTSAVEWLLPSRQARFFGPAVALVGLAALGFAGVVVATTPGPVAHRLLAGALPALLGVLFAFGGWLLAARRGGVGWDAERVYWFGDRSTAWLSVRRQDVEAVIVDDREEGDPAAPSLVSGASLLLRSRVRVLLAETAFRDALDPLVAAAAGELHIPRTPPAGPAARPARAASTHTFRVGAQGLFPIALGSTALAMLFAGGIAMWDVQHPLIGTFVGTPLVAMGLILGLVPLVKGLMTEHLFLNEDGHFEHHYTLAGIQFGARSGRADPNGHVRVRHRGLLGATIELVGEGRLQLIAGGVQGRTRFGPDDLLRLAERLEFWRSGT